MISAQKHYRWYEFFIHNREQKTTDMKESDLSNKLSKTDTKTQYEAKIRKLADSLDARISDAEEKIKDVKEEARSEYQLHVNALKEKRTEVASHIAELETITEVKWENARDKFQSRFQTLSAEITAAYEGIVSGFAYLFKKITN